LELPRIVNATDASLALSTVLEAVAAGRLRPEEGQILASLIEKKLKALASVDLEQKLEELERLLQDEGSNEEKT
jgi:hypothetical protein